MNFEHLEVALRRALHRDPFWEGYLPSINNRDRDAPSVHLAVFVEPFLGFVLNGSKTVESRFSANRIAPFNSVRHGDVILLKSAGGPIQGICRAAEVWSYRVQPGSWREIRNRFARAMCAEEPEFWEARSRASYATLIRIENVRALPDIPFAKSDRRGWVVISASAEQLEFPVL